MWPDSTLVLMSAFTNETFKSKLSVYSLIMENFSQQYNHVKSVRWPNIKIGNMRKCDTMDSQMHLIGNATRPLYTDPVFENHTIIGDARSHTNHDIYILEGQKNCKFQQVE